MMLLSRRTGHRTPRRIRGNCAPGLTFKFGFQAWRGRPRHHVLGAGRSRGALRPVPALANPAGKPEVDTSRRRTCQQQGCNLASAVARRYLGEQSKPAARFRMSPSSSNRNWFAGLQLLAACTAFTPRILLPSCLLPVRPVHPSSNHSIRTSTQERNAVVAPREPDERKPHLIVTTVLPIPTIVFNLQVRRLPVASFIRSRAARVRSNCRGAVAYGTLCTRAGAGNWVSCRDFILVGAGSLREAQQRRDRRRDQVPRQYQYTVCRERRGTHRPRSHAIRSRAKLNHL